MKLKKIASLALAGIMAVSMLAGSIWMTLSIMLHIITCLKIIPTR